MGELHFGVNCCSRKHFARTTPIAVERVLRALQGHQDAQEHQDLCRQGVCFLLGISDSIALISLLLADYVLMKTLGWRESGHCKEYEPFQTKPAMWISEFSVRGYHRRIRARHLSHLHISSISFARSSRSSPTTCSRRGRPSPLTSSRGTQRPLCLQRGKAPCGCRHISLCICSAYYCIPG